MQMRETVARQRHQLVVVQIQRANVGQAADNVWYRGQRGVGDPQLLQFRRAS